MSLTVDVKTVVSNLRSKVPFLQPLYEAVTNALEANATQITVILEEEVLLLNETDAKITGFVVRDNGEGFTEKNVNSFTKLWSDAKKDLGCKGYGRITWLKVFEKVQVLSEVAGQKVAIDFNLNFDIDRDIKRTSVPKAGKSFTEITFADVTGEYYTQLKDKTIDNREIGDLKAIKEKVEQHLRAKLFLMKKDGKKFNIELSIGQEKVTISDKNIIELTQTTFTLKDSLSGTPHTFDLYHRFIQDKQDEFSLFYCGHGRVVSEFVDAVSLNSLPDKSSAVMLLTSPYLDERVNDERNRFNFESTENNPSIDNPLPFPEINRQLKMQVDQIVLKKYPAILEDNKGIEEDCINKYPHLAKYIKQDTSIIKDEKLIVKKAQKTYETEKEAVEVDFANLLKKKNIDETEFLQTVNRVKDISARELAQYIVYRKHIIEALAKMAEDNEKTEKLLHNIFAEMKTESKTPLSAYDSNIWLLDDKYMTYTYLASDKTIKQICDKIDAEDQKTYKSKNRPDLTIFYSSKEADYKNIVAIEFKALGASLEEKNKSLTELPRNVKIIKENIKNIKETWAYVITSIDNDFAETIETQDYKKLFTSGGERVYYRYMENIAAHLYVVSIDAIIKDAETRNNVFLNIIKKS